MIAGRYSLDREIGRGGMGAVWLAHDEVLDRPVALKRIGLLPGADTTDLARAEREAQLAARLNHPHIVAVLNLVVDAETDARWLVMEYVDGATLAQLVRADDGLPPDEAAPILWQAADALVAAHAAGIVHRDVKPSNILVDRSGRVKLADFGIARVLADPSITQTGLLTGSPAYLAPEVASGRRGDEAADVWSLGATVFHVLSGRPPYEMGESVLGGLYRIVHEEPPRLPDAGVLAPLLEHTMVKDPAERWPMTRVRDFLGGWAPPTWASGPGDLVLPGPVRPAGAGGAAAAAGAAAVPPAAGAAPTPSPAPATTPLTARAAEDDLSTTRVVDTSPGPVAGGPPDAPSGPGAAPVTPPPDQDRPRRGPGTAWMVALVAVALAAVLAGVLVAGSLGGDTARESAADPAASAASTTSAADSPAQSSSPAEPSTSAAAGPTRQGMEAFVRDYVQAVSTDPDTAWQMLTRKFQAESGGLDTYRDFWSGVGPGRVLEVSADPESLVVSYRVRFENFGTGRRPTVLELEYADGRYRIDGERTEGFVPAG